MKLTCESCAKSFEGENEKFCSQGCRDSYIVDIEKRTREAVANDPSHISQMSKDQ